MGVKTKFQRKNMLNILMLIYLIKYPKSMSSAIHLMSNDVLENPLPILLKSDYQLIRRCWLLQEETGYAVPVQ